MKALARVEMSSLPENNRPFEVVDEHRVPAVLDAAIRDLLVTCFPAEAAVFKQG